MKELLKLNDISKFYYSSTNAALGLRKINLSFGQGEFVVITGESGSGKSTLLNVISGNDTYEEGEMYFNGLETSHFDADDWQEFRRNQISFIFQNYNLIDSYSVLDNVVAAVLIEGYTKSEAVERAKVLIDKVGLSNRINNKAAKLSSGQKQRLAIARALVKDTPIIMADEPTGNLDSANGKQILKLLYELSKEKLVLIASHNFEQAKEYATRKIRLFDGEIVEDSIFELPNNLKMKEINNTKPIITYKTSFNFVANNLKNQPKRVIITMLLIMLITCTTFLLFSTFVSNLDDSFTRIRNDKVFQNVDPLRIVVKRQDGKPLNNDDYIYFSNIKHIDAIEKDEYIDLNYYYGKDYEIKYTYYRDSNLNIIEQSSSVMFLSHDHTLRSTMSISNKDLRAGSLPNNKNEIVLYDTDSSMLGKKEKIYIRKNNIFLDDAYMLDEFKVVGLLKEPTEQIYFSESFVSEMSYYSFPRTINIDVTVFESTNITKTIKDVNIALNRGLGTNTIICPDNYKDQINNIVKIIMYTTDDYESVRVYNSKFVIADSISNKFIEVSEDIFYQFHQTMANLQASLFLSDYSYSTNTIEKLTDNGYIALSPFKSTAYHYDQNLVWQRLLTIIISIAIMIILYFLEIVTMRALLKFKKNDYIIFKTMGMSNKTIKQINYLEIFFYFCISLLFIVFMKLLSSIFNLGDFSSYLFNLTKYFGFWHYFVFILINVLTSFIISYTFNKYLISKTHVGALKGD